MRQLLRLLPILAVASVSLLGCRSRGPAIAPEVSALAPGRSIVACGKRIDIGAPVVLWTEEGGYSAYETDFHFGTPVTITPDMPASGKLRYEPGRRDRATGLVEVEPETGTLDQLKRALDLFVLHYDAGLTSETCFRTLHDRRGLSVHFMLDLDGTLYQTMDLRDTAWHARQANARSIGIEIANIGAYPLEGQGAGTLERYYAIDERGPRFLPERTLSELGVRTPAFEARPARPGLQRGRIHGTLYEQYDFTPEQYETLVKLTAALVETFPNLEPDAPRDAEGRVLTTNMTPEEEAAFHGLVGHFHVGGHKQDPGPAFDWELFLTKVRARTRRI